MTDIWCIFKIIYINQKIVVQYGPLWRTTDYVCNGYGITIKYKKLFAIYTSVAFIDYLDCFH